MSAEDGDNTIEFNSGQYWIIDENDEIRSIYNPDQQRYHDLLQRYSELLDYHMGVMSDAVKLRDDNFQLNIEVIKLKKQKQDANELLEEAQIRLSPLRHKLNQIKFEWDLERESFESQIKNKDAIIANLRDLLKEEKSFNSDNDTTELPVKKRKLN